MNNYRTTIIAVLFAGLAVSAFAQQAEVSYFQGTASLKSAGGRSIPVDFGTTMNAGDSIITGGDGVVQLDQAGGSQITVQANSVFTLQKRYQDSQQETVMTTVLGAVSYRFARLAGSREPAIATMSSVAGIRGTVFTVYAGSDGTSRYEVTEGMVEVQSAGQSVDLTKDQAVEVAAGAPPGKVEVLVGPVDFSKWNAQKEQSVAKDPIAVLKSVSTQMDSYIAEVKKLTPEYQDLKTKLTDARAVLKKMANGDQKDQSQTFYQEKVHPLELQTTNTVLNLRYWVLSALSLRKYVMGRMFLITTVQHLKGDGSIDYPSFVALFNQIDVKFRQTAIEYLEPTDI